MRIKTNNGDTARMLSNAAANVVNSPQSWVAMNVGCEIEGRKGIALGADSYITKPFSTQELLAQIRKQLNEPDAALRC